MFGGRVESVSLFCEESLAGVIVDRFGESINMIRENGGFSVAVSVVVSPMFLSWVASFGGRIKITAPVSVCDAYRELLMSALGENRS